MIRPRAWWLLYDIVREHATGQDEAADLTDQLYATISHFLTTKGKEPTT